MHIRKLKSIDYRIPNDMHGCFHGNHDFFQPELAQLTESDRNKTAKQIAEELRAYVDAYARTNSDMVSSFLMISAEPTLYRLLKVPRGKVNCGIYENRDIQWKPPIWDAPGPGILVYYIRCVLYQ